MLRTSMGRTSSSVAMPPCLIMLQNTSLHKILMILSQFDWNTEGNWFDSTGFNRIQHDYHDSTSTSWSAVNAAMHKGCLVIQLGCNLWGSLPLRQESRSAACAFRQLAAFHTPWPACVSKTATSAESSSRRWSLSRCGGLWDDSIYSQCNANAMPMKP